MEEREGIIKNTVECQDRRNLRAGVSNSFSPGATWLGATLTVAFKGPNVVSTP